MSSILYHPIPTHPSDPLSHPTLDPHPTLHPLTYPPLDLNHLYTQPLLDPHPLGSLYPPLGPTTLTHQFSEALPPLHPIPTQPLEPHHLCIPLPTQPVVLYHPLHPIPTYPKTSYTGCTLSATEPHHPIAQGTTTPTLTTPRPPMPPTPHIHPPTHPWSPHHPQVQFVSLLDKVGCVVIGDFQKCIASSYVYETIYGHKKVCHKKMCLEQNILLVLLYGIRSFHAPFHIFHNVSIYV